ncbi:alpha/beta hydrolase [Kangiella sp. HZ709]|uniref:alpha/beta hydrolase n=1 Tax=Kangiella sp. HZ709 TaxID=2666328 RepID=UPI0012B0A397|nr:alpha/beta hydrolase [Kangiella sp. HZ709]MRX27685.1 alpha/beta fold hydrolase [Kangiella sp. HZ709]
MKSLLLIMAILVLGYLVYSSAFYLLQRKILFPLERLPEPNADLIYSADGEIVRLPFSQGEFEIAYLPSLKALNKTAPVIILAHGNGNIMDSWAPNMDVMRNRGFAVVLVEYPGYGRSQGQPTYQSIRETMAIVYNWTRNNAELDQSKISLIGRSMGGGAVLSLFDGAIDRDNEPYRVVLMSTYSSIADVAAKKWLPSTFVKDPFDNVTQLAKYSGKSYLIHGDQDKVVPFDSLQKLLAVAKDARHKVYSGGHDDIPDNWLAFWQDVAEFIE